MFSEWSVFVVAHSLECEFHTKCTFQLGEMCEGHAMHWSWAFTPPHWCEFGGFTYLSLYTAPN